MPPPSGRKDVTVEANAGAPINHSFATVAGLDEVQRKKKLAAIAISDEATPQRRVAIGSS